jgi:hypothetical protein
MSDSEAEAEDSLFSNVTYYPTGYHGSLKVLRHIESFPATHFVHSSTELLRIGRHGASG